MVENSRGEMIYCQTQRPYGGMKPDELVIGKLGMFEQIHAMAYDHVLESIVGYLSTIKSGCAWISPILLIFFSRCATVTLRPQ